MLPRVTMEGKVAAEPELRFGQSGTAICRLRLVANDRRRNEHTGEWEDTDTLWMDVTCFKQLAENVVESITKGDLVVVTGKIRTEEWEDRETGQKRSKVALIADTVAASLQFRVLPHAGATHAARSPQRPPGEQMGRPEPAYSGSDSEPPF